ncbi:AAA family ATPase [Streptomyces sp. NPDC005574]|uniref:AAA family ATPase n=1 Tax=Streptomyces sp. NPDC005574 TaxID=3156891 RepID=UPI0033BCBFE4
MSNVRHMQPDQADPHGSEQYDAERYVLGGSMHKPRDIPAVRALIRGADFALPQHERIWNALGHLYDHGTEINPFTLRVELEQRKELGLAGGLAYINQLGDWALDAEYHAELVRKAADLRAEADLGRRIVQQATAPDAEPGAAVTFIDDYLQRQKERAHGRSGDPADALLAELLDASSLDNMPTLEPLVGDLLHLDSLARVVGPSGHMKSFMVIDFAAHVGTGMKWHGHHVRQGTVVYLVAEGARGIRKRVRAWEKHHGVKMTDVLFLPRPVQAMSPEWDTLIEAMRRLAPSMIVIDTQARVSVGVEENSAKELGLVVDRMEQLRAATGACVLVIHHTGHVGEHGRGSSSAKGALQSELHVSKKGDRAANIVVTLKTGKQKDDEEGSDLQFGLKVITLDGEKKPDGRPVTSVVLESLDLRPKPLERDTPEWLVVVLDQAGIDMAWGAPRVIKWCQTQKIDMAKNKIEKAVQMRKARDSFDDPRLTASVPFADLPKNLPSGPYTQTPQPELGRSGEFGDNPRSDLPKNAGEVMGRPITEPPSPTPLSRGWGGQGEGGETDTADTPSKPLCNICRQPMNADWAARGYDTHIGCDPATGSHPRQPHDAA